MHDPDREATYGPEEERAMIELAKSDDREQRRGAAYCLGDVKAPTAETLATLFELAASDDETTAKSAVASVAQIADRYDPAPVDALVAATTHERARVREAALHAFGNMKRTESARVVDRLLAMLDDADADVLAAACENVGFYARDRERERVVRALLAALERAALPDRAREAVIQSLGNAYLDEPSRTPEDVRAAVIAQTRHANPKVVAIARWAATCFDRPDPAPAAEPDDEVLTIDEAQRRLDAIDAYYTHTGRLFFAGAGCIAVAIVFAFTKPIGAAVFGVVGLVFFALWNGRKKRSPDPTAHMRAQIALARAQLGRMRQILDEVPKQSPRDD